MADLGSNEYFFPQVNFIYKNGDKIYGSIITLKDRKILKGSMVASSFNRYALFNKWIKVHNTRMINSDVVRKKPSFKCQSIYNCAKRIMSVDLRNEFKKELWSRGNTYSVPSFIVCESDATNEVRIKSQPKSCHKFRSDLLSPLTKKNVDTDNISDYTHSSSDTNLNIKFSYKVYRCQLFKPEDDSCCCSCNSDAMFEVMKSLYDCYKKKNCDNCCCILCGHLPREERKLGELRKSAAQIAEEKRLKMTDIRAYEGKSLAEKEQIFKELALAGKPLPEAKTDSDKNLIKKIRTEIGLPPEPTTVSDNKKLSNAYKAGIVIPLEGKTTAQKEKILTNLAENGISLPEGRTTSEKALIEKIRATVPPKKPSKAARPITTLAGKSKKEKKKILKGLVKKGMPLPEAKTASDQMLIDQVRLDVGLPPEPKTETEKENYKKAMAAGIITPLEGKKPAKKEKILRQQAKMGLQLPEGRTPSEKALISKIKETSLPEKETRALSEKLRKAKDAGLLTPLEGKSREQKEKILKELAKIGVPLPEAKTASDQKLIDQVRFHFGLPPEPKTDTEKENYKKAIAAGIITPLEGKKSAKKEKILREQAKMGLQLPEGRTPSEKALISKIKETSEPVKEILPPSKKRRKDKLVEPPSLEGKSKEQKVKILKGLAKKRLPLPEAKTASDQKLIDQVRLDVGLPPEPKTETEKENYKKAMAAGIITPLEGKKSAKKEKILREQAKMGLQLPEGRTPSEKALISKIKETSEPIEEILAPPGKMRKAKLAGFPSLEGKSKEQKKKILKGLAKQGMPLPEAKTASDQMLIDQVRFDVGLPPEPKTETEKENYKKAMAAGIITPLEGKKPAKKEKILRQQAKMGLQLPEGRSPSEKALIAKVKETTQPEIVKRVPSEKLRKAKLAGLLTPLEGKPKEQKVKILKGLAKQGIPLPEAKTASDQKLIDKVRIDIGLPPEPKTATDKENYNRAMAAGIITPLEGKSAAKKEKILREQAKMGLQLPEGRSPSEKALIAIVKETTHPEIAKRVPSEKLRKAKLAGLLTPLEGKSKEQKKNILTGLAKQGIPLPEAKTASDQKLIDQVRFNVGLPPEPKTVTDRDNYNKAMAAGIITPLEGKPTAKKEKILREQAKMGLQLPEGRTRSEKALIEKVKAETPSTKPVRAWRPALPPDKLKKMDLATSKGLKESKGPSDECICDLLTPKKDTTYPEIAKHVPSEKLRKAKLEGLLTPLEGKPKEQKIKILKGLAKQGIPLPEAKTASDQKLIDQVRLDIGLPPEPKTAADKEKYKRAIAAGIITPLESKSTAKKEKILREQAKMGLQLPEGRTPSERALIAKIKETTPEIVRRVPSEKLRKAKLAGLLTPLEGKSKDQKLKILTGLAKQGIPFPEPKTSSDRKLMDKVRMEIGLPPEPKSTTAKERYDKAMAAGIVTPLEGKSTEDKEKILRDQIRMGLQLPEGRSPSEKALIAKVKETTQPEIVKRVPSEKLRKAKLAGLLTPLEGKPKEQKVKILKGLAKQGIPLPEAKTASDQKLIDKVRIDIGLPPEPKTATDKENYNRAMAAGIITPLEGKSAAKKEKILREQAKMGLQLPEGRSPSEKALIAKVKETTHPEIAKRVPSEKLRKAKLAGLLTPLEGKSKEQKKKILTGLAKQGIPFPEPKTSSDRKLMDKVRMEIGLPPEPKSTTAKERYDKAMAAGIVTPLEGKSTEDKEKILRDQIRMGLQLPEGRSPSEKALIAKVKETTHPETARRVPSEKLRKAKLAGLLTPLEGKPKEQKVKILKGLAKQGIPLPEAKTVSDQKLIDKVRIDIGLPPEPKTATDKENYNRAMAAGIITPLEGKSAAKKEKILREQAKMGLRLPEGRSPSEKALIAKVKETTHPEIAKRVPSEKLRKAKLAGLLTPLEGKSKEQKKKILTGLAKQGIPFPEPKTSSDRKLMDKVRVEVGLPPEPKTTTAKEKYDKALAAGIITPLEGKSHDNKEKILRDQMRMGLQLPEGRTPSEKALIAKVKETTHPEIARRVPSEKLRKAKLAGLLTPLEGKPKEQKVKILKGLAKQGIPLPEAKTASDQKLIDKVRIDIGLPPEPKTAADTENYNRAMAAGIITPLEGKSAAKKEKILREQAKMGLQLPEGRTPSEKALIAKVKETTPEIVKRVPSEKLRKAKLAGLLTPLEGKSKDQKLKILTGLAKQGIPFPEPKTSSDRKLMDKVRMEIGLPPEPKSTTAKERYDKAMAAGIVTPLEGKSTEDKEKILRDQIRMGLQLPEGRSPSEKALIAKVKETTQPEIVKRVPSEKLRKAKLAGLLTPLEGKPKEQKVKILKGLAKQGIPLPEAKTASDQKLIDKVRIDIGLPPEPKTATDKENYNRAMAAGIITPLEGKSAAKKEKILREQAKMGLQLPEGRSPSEKALIAKVKETTHPEIAKRVPSEKLRKAKLAGLLTPLEGKSKEQKKNILTGLAKQGIPLPEAKTASDQKLIDQVRFNVGLPPEPKTVTDRDNYNKAMAAGIITPLEGKPTAKKEKILREQAKMGLQLPEGRTPSEKALIEKVKAETPSTKPVRAWRPALPPDKLKKMDLATSKGLKESEVPSDECICDLLTPIKDTMRPEVVKHVPSEKLRKAKLAGLLTPLEGKSKEQKIKILKGLAKHGIPLPEAKTVSDQKLIDKVRFDMGLPPEPETASDKENYNRAMAAGIITPLEDKPTAKKEKILREQAKMGLQLPEGRSPSEKALIAKVKETTQPELVKHVPSEKLRRAKLAGLLTPLEGKSKEQKVKILKGLAKQGVPLPEAKTVSDQKLIDKVRLDMGLPPEPKTSTDKENYKRAMAAGIITPLEGKSTAKKEKILREQAKMGIKLPEGRNPSEKALIAKIKETTQPEIVKHVPSEKLRKAKLAGLLTPLEGKSKEQKVKILKGLAKQGIPFPEPKSSSDRKLMDKVRVEVGLPPEPKSTSAKDKYNKAMAAGIITPLEGKSMDDKEKILRDQMRMGLQLPEGRSPSEKALIAKVKETAQPETIKHVPSEKLRKAKLAGLLTPLEGKSKEQKVKILKGLAKQGVPLPEAKTASDQKLIDKVRLDMGLPPEPETASDKENYNRAMAAGIITPLEGKSTAKKEKILREQAKMGLRLPEGRSPSEKALIAKVKETTHPEIAKRVPSEKLRKAKLAGLLTPLEGKSKEQKKKILTGLAKQGIPLPEAKTASDQKLIDKVRLDMGLPPEPETASDKENYNRAMAAGIITPLEGKSTAKKEKILREQAKMGLQLPEGRSPSEKALIAKVKETTQPEIVKYVPSEKLRKAKLAGLLTPLEGKSKEQKVKILKGLAKQGVPLPEAKTASDQKLIDKVRLDMGLPPEPKTSTDKENYKRAMAAGIITPLEGKSTAKKEKILREQAKMGLKLPEGRNPSEKALIAKIKETTQPEIVKHVPSEKLRKAKLAGLLTPLEGKSKEQKVKILKGLAKQGIPFPEPKSSSDRKLMDKVRVEVGLPPEPKSTSAKDKYNKAMAAGIITPLEGKSMDDKEKILRDQMRMGLQLPEGRSPSEKALIAKVKETAQPETIKHVPSEKLRKAKLAGLLTPLEGKSKEQKVKILKGLAKQGVPLPEAKTASDQKLIDKVRLDMGLPPEPETASDKENYNRAMAAGIITPLEGKSTAKKEKILREQAKLGLELPEGRTSSEKALIEKVRATTPTKPLKAKKIKKKERPSVECICSESEGLGISVIKLPSKKKAKSAEFLTSLEGKKPEEKKKILKALAMKGIPLPKAKSDSEQIILDEVHAEVGLPPLPKTAQEQEAYNKAMASGLITPLQGKPARKKEEILLGQAKMGVPLPEGRTSSEKALISKIKDKYEKSLIKPKSVAAEERGGVKKKSKKIGGVAKKKGVGALYSKGDITEEYEDIVKTTTCDRGCGCDKKKIRFKHSYVKIRVTSPDISNLCPCPEECIPGVKGGVFTDEEGIKVTIGRVIGIPRFFSREFSNMQRISTDDTIDTISPRIPEPKFHIKKMHSQIDTDKKFSSDTIISIKPHYKPQLLNFDFKEGFDTLQASSSSSLDTFYFIKTDSSISLTTTSIPSSVTCYSISETSSYLDNYIQVNDNEGGKLNIKNNTNRDVYHSSDSVLSASSIWSTGSNSSQLLSVYPEHIFDREIVQLRAVQSEYNQFIALRKQRSTSTYQDRSLTTEITSDSEMSYANSGTQSTLEDTSSLIILIQTSSDECDANYSYTADGPESITCIQISENCSYLNNIKKCPQSCIYKRNVLKLVSKDKQSNDEAFAQVATTNNTNCNHLINENQEKTCLACPVTGKSKRIISTDTTEDRPCCCVPIEKNNVCKKLMESRSCRKANEEPEKPKLSVAVSVEVCCKEDLPSIPPKPNLINNSSNTSECQEAVCCPCPHKTENSCTPKEKRPSDNNMKTKTKKEKTVSKKNKNVISECPEKPEFQDTWVDENQIKLIKSELTQCVSGFKVNTQRRSQEPECSFEEILQCFAEKAEQKHKKADKKKPISKKKDSVDCECSKFPVVEQPLRGIKFHIGAKGSKSKGLAGILCFPLHISRSMN